jgi:hypothetical protein
VSAIRKAPGVYVDPYTGGAFAPRPLGAVGPGPVEIVRPGSCPPPDHVPVHRTGYVLVNRQQRGTYIAHLSDAEVLGAVAAHGSQHEAAEALHVSQSSLARRLRQIRQASA